MLDLDTVAWVPNQVAMERSAAEARSLVRSFCESCEHWVVEGCYTHLAKVALDYWPVLLLLNPGLAQCIENCQARPWEPHKYAAKTEQDAQLGFLLIWVADYYTRRGDLSFAEHRACFDSYSGPKHEITRQPQLSPTSDEVLAWLA